MKGWLQIQAEANMEAWWFCKKCYKPAHGILCVLDCEECGSRDRKGPRLWHPIGALAVMDEVSEIRNN